jgi:hypothetical protein
MLDREALRLLLETLEAPESVITAAVIQDLHPRAGAALVDPGLLVADGHELAVADAMGMPVTALPSDMGGFGFFNGKEGWVEVDPDSLVRFRVDIDTLARNLLPEDAVLITRKSQVLIDDFLWDLARLDRAGKKVEVWLARRVFVPAVWSAMTALLQRRSPYELRIMLTSTPAARLPEQTLPGAVIMPIEDVISVGDELRIHRSTLLSLLSGAAGPTPGKRIQMSADGHTFLVDGQPVMSFTSEIHLYVIRELVKGYVKGDRFNASDLLKKAGAKVTTFERAFGTQRWGVLRCYLKSSDGRWGFED